MTMSIIIRKAHEDDLPFVLEIVNYEILNSTAIWDYDARSLSQQTAIFKEKEEKNQPFLVAEKDGMIVGFGTYGTFRFKVGYRFTVEHSVYVRQGFQGLGIGALLMKELILIAKEQQLHTMIGVIDSENLGSITFHEKLGFQKAGHLKETGYKFDRWLDSIFMQLLLD